MSERRIVMLDFDGVLNRVDEFGFNIGPEIDRTLAQRVGRMVKDVNAFVVVSSDWRKWYSLPELQQILRRHAGIPVGRVVDTTGVGNVRGHEIQKWLVEFKQPVRLAVLDDNHEGRFCMDVVRPWFVHTDPQEGITDANVEAATALLTTGPLYYAGAELTNSQPV